MKSCQPEEIGVRRFGSRVAGNCLKAKYAELLSISQNNEEAGRKS